MTNYPNSATPTQLDAQLKVIERNTGQARHMLNARIMVDVDRDELMRRIKVARGAMVYLIELLEEADASSMPRITHLTEEQKIRQLPTTA